MFYILMGRRQFCLCNISFYLSLFSAAQKALPQMLLQEQHEGEVRNTEVGGGTGKNHTSIHEHPP